MINQNVGTAGIGNGTLNSKKRNLIGNRGDKKALMVQGKGQC